MTGARLTAALECANDAGGRCALWPSGDAHACYGVSHDTATSCAFAAGSVSAARAALTGDGSDPPVRGPGTGSEAGVFAHPCPRPPGVAPEPSIPTREGGFERRLEAADHQFADRPAVWQPGITEQGRGTPDGWGRSPSRQVRDAPVPGDRGATAKQPATYGNRWRAHRNGGSVHHAPRCRCARAVCHGPPVIGGQDRPPEPLSTRLENNLPMIAPDS